MTGRFPILYIAERDAEEAVMSSGVLAALVDSVPHADFTIVGSKASAPLFADTPRLERLITAEGEGRKAAFDLWRQVRGRTWGLIVDQRGGPLSGFLSRKRRAVRQADDLTLNAAEDAARRLHLDETPGPRLFVGAQTRAVADALIGPVQAPILAIGPGVDWIGKRWPAERFAKAATQMLGADGPLAGARLMTVGSDADTDAAHHIRLAVSRDRVIEAQGRLTPLQTVAALSRARLYLGVDSLWTQLAAASGAPTLALFGPSDDRRRAPWGARVVRGTKAVADFRRVDPNLTQHIQHMMDLPVDPVVKAARKLLAETEGSQP